MDDETANWIQTAVDKDTSIAVELAALMLDNDADAVYRKATLIPILSIPSVLSLSSAIIAILAERLAELEGISPEEILLELRCWSRKND